MRPNLEYATAVWDPHRQEQIDSIEAVQWHAARFIIRDYNKTSSVTEMLQSRARGAVFKVRGPATTSFEVGWGVGANLAVLSLWLFRTVRLLNLSLVIVERSHIYKFQAAEKYFSPAETDCTCRIHQSAL